MSRLLDRLKQLFVFSFLCILLFGCKKDSNDPPADSPDKANILEGEWEMTGNMHISGNPGTDSYLLSTSELNGNLLAGIKNGQGYDLLKYNGATWTSIGGGGIQNSITQTNGGDVYSASTMSLGQQCRLARYNNISGSWDELDITNYSDGIGQLEIFSVNNKIYRLINAFYGFELSEWNNNSWVVQYTDSSATPGIEYVKCSVQEVNGKDHVLINFNTPSNNGNPAKQIWYKYDGYLLTELYREYDDVERPGTLFYLNGKYLYFQHFYGGNDYGGTNIVEVSGGALGATVATSKTNHYWYHVFSNGDNMFLLSSKVSLPVLVINEIFHFDGSTWTQYPTEIAAGATDIMGFAGNYDQISNLHAFKIGNTTHAFFDYIYAASTVGNPTRAFHLTFQE